ncbi:YadA-like family protein, partial [Testudinibacter sp. TR-2022]|uniref:YadA-like family protein n=1 Tax=Testudinibacter sp. TR-2022 TaxID=2585029 RepID=UPI0011694018
KEAVTGGQLFTVKTTADNAKTTADNAKTTADEAKDIASNLKDGVDGLQGVIGTAGKDGLNGKGGAAGQDGLNGKDAISQIVDIRQGEAGTVVYTDANGNRLSVEDGKYYQRAADGSADKSKEVAANAVRLSAVNADGTTTAPTVLGNLADGKLAADSKEAVTGGQLFTVKTTADNAKTTADEAKSMVAGLKDGIDGLNGLIGKNGQDGTNGTNGKDGAAGQDGLNGKDLVDKNNALRNGQAGAVVYTAEDGKRLARGEDGKFYAMKADGTADTTTTAVATDKVRLSVVNADGLTTTPTVLGNLADGKLAADSKEAVTGGQLFTVKTTADNAKTTADNAKTTADEAKDIASNLKNGIDGLAGAVGTPGQDGSNGTNGKNGAAGRDGLNGKDLTEKVNSLRNGEAGAVVYTAENGSRLARGEDGKFYLMKADGSADTTIAAVADDKVRLSAVNANGSTTAPTVLNNIADGVQQYDAVNVKQLNAVKETAAGNTTAITNLTTKINQISQAGFGLVQDDAASSTITIGKDSDSTILSIVGSAGNRTLTGVANGTNAGDAVNKGQLDAVEKTANLAKTTADEAKSVVAGLKDGIDGLNGLIGKNGQDGTNGTNGKNGAAGQDGLNGKDLVDKTNALRNGQAGAVVYTAEDGKRLARGEDGKFYALKADGSADTTTAAITDDKVRLSVVNADGLTTTPTILSNLKDGLVGQDSHDAVTGGQLYTTNQKVGELETKVQALASGSAGVAGNDKGALKYDKDASGQYVYNKATLGVDPNCKAGSNPNDPDCLGEGVVLSNVKGGKVAKGSKEVVNGGQLYSAVTSLAGTGSEMVVNPDGSITVNASYTVYNNDGTSTTVNNVGAALDHINSNGTKYIATNSELKPAAATGKESVAVGGGAVAKGEGSVAMGSGSVARDPLEFSVGNAETGLTRRITNVADGVNASDAATVGQVSRALGNVHSSLKQEIQQTRKIASQGIAASMAMNLDLPQQHPGEVAIGVGTAMYDGQSAVALGGNYLTNSGKIKISLGVGSSLGKEARPAVKAGVGWVF